jgi:hypothetical protein
LTESANQMSGQNHSQGSNGARIMPFGTNPVSHADGSLAATRALVQDCRSGLRGKTIPFGHQESIGRNTQGGVMMKAPPTVAFIVT